jgi:hypothetical protein
MAKKEKKITVKANIKLSIEKLYEFFHKADNLKDKVKFYGLINIELNK